jgi:hypothetical protein
MQDADITQYLAALGELLARDRVSVGLVLVGGAALLLQGFHSRTTTDIDIIGTVGPGGSPRVLPPSSLPPEFHAAVRRVARDFGLPPNWINDEVSAQLRTGLPPGFAGRITWRQYGALRAGLASRRDLIFLKLFAATDQDPKSRHTSDLLILRPTPAELKAAAAWVKTQDASPAFADMLTRVIAHVQAHTS